MQRPALRAQRGPPRYPRRPHERNLQTKAGEVRLKVPKLCHQTFETAIIERYGGVRARSRRP